MKWGDGSGKACVRPSGDPGDLKSGDLLETGSEGIPDDGFVGRRCSIVSSYDLEGNRAPGVQACSAACQGLDQREMRLATVTKVLAVRRPGFPVPGSVKVIAASLRRVWLSWLVRMLSTCAW